MSDGLGSVSFFDCDVPDDPLETVLDAAAKSGFDVDGVPSDPEPGPLVNADAEFSLPYENWEVSFRLYVSDDFGPEFPELDVHLGASLAPAGSGDEKYQAWMDTVLELVARLATALHAQYAPVYGTDLTTEQVAPDDRPIGDSVLEAPRFGVFSASVLDEFGGLDATYADPWFVAELPGGQTLVIDSDAACSGGSWRPPADAAFLEQTQGGT